MSVKTKVLAILEEHKGTSISGSEIADEIGMTRGAVWKAIKQLQSAGYPIVAATNRGYCLSSESDLISEESIKPLLKSKYFGNKIEAFKTIDSTNTFAKKLAQQGASHGHVVISEQQTSGKGRLERNFYSPTNSGIYMTILLRPKLSMDKASLITSCAAAAVALAIENVTGINTKIKWVNDIFVNGKKLCGILTEAGMDFESGTLEYAVVGIGINVSTESFPDELKNVATSLAIESKSTFSRSRLIAEILNVFEEYYDTIETKEFLSEYISRSNIIGKEITVIGAVESYTATAVKIDDNARLIVKTSDGIEKILNSGEISIRAKQY